MLLDLHSSWWRNKGCFAWGIQIFPCALYRSAMSEIGMKDFPEERGEREEAMLSALEIANLAVPAFALEGRGGSLSALKAKRQGWHIWEATHGWVQGRFPLQTWLRREMGFMRTSPASSTVISQQRWPFEKHRSTSPSLFPGESEARSLPMCAAELPGLFKDTQSATLRCQFLAPVTVGWLAAARQRQP